MTKQEVITFGCRLNAYESEVIKGHLETSGENNIVVFNTCAVTKEAERQAKQAIRRYNRENPEAKIIVTGCGAQLDPVKYSSLPGVTKVLGNEEKLKQENYIFNNNSSGTEKILVNDIMSVRETASHLVAGFEEKIRAFLQIQNGCNHRCTFCIIPFARGNSRSVPIGEIVQQARLLVDNGYNEIVLTGVDITDYGKDLPGSPSLGQMIKRLLSLVPDLPRLRLSSVDVAEIDDELLEVIATNKRFMPHLHLSLQSGDNMILKRMRRRHTREQVIEFCTKTRKIRSDMIFGADIIAGFPTETDEMFKNTLDIINEAEIMHLHVFPYSERKGTPAANIPADKQIPVSLRKERAAILREAGQKQLQKFLRSRIGQIENIIIEKDGIGRTEHFATAELLNYNNAGMIMQARVASVSDTRLICQ